MDVIKFSNIAEKDKTDFRINKLEERILLLEAQVEQLSSHKKIPQNAPPSKIHLDEMTPYELGESQDVRAVEYLIKFLQHGSDNHKRLAASAISKLTDQFKKECSSVVPILMNNLNSLAPQLRQYTLKALKKFELKEDEIQEIEIISESDDKEYNRKLALEILSQYLK